MLELAPRPPLDKKVGIRVKKNVTIDASLWQKLEEAHQAGYSVSHLIDSGLWHLFDKPPLSFQEGKNETNHITVSDPDDTAL